MSQLRSLRAPLLSACLLLSLNSYAAPRFTLSSPDLSSTKPIAEKHVFNSFGCTGGNLSPALTWRNAPTGTQSFALLVHDPDAPTGGSGFWHWLVLDIPANTQELAQNAGSADGKNLPAGSRQINSDYGQAAWGGPCPPVGHKGKKAHHYNFTLYALKVAKLDVPAGASAAVVGYFVNANALAQAKLSARYGR